MFRTFNTHHVRKEFDLTGSEWFFTPLAKKDPEVKIPVFVPCCTENIPGFEQYRGESLYQRQVEIMEDADNVSLVFYGVSFNCTVLWDGMEAGTHYGAYTAFSCILHNVNKGLHTLKVIADNRFSEKSALHVPNDYMSYGGIIRGVSMEILPDVSIKRIGITPAKEGNAWSLSVDISMETFDHSNEKYMIKTKVIDAETREVIKETDDIEIPQTADDGTASLTLNIAFSAEESSRIKEWNPDAPHLYEFEAVLKKDDVIIDDLIERFGFRTVTVSGRDILVNGRKVRFKGLCRHEDHPMFGAALPYQVMEQDLQIMRDLGANAVRTTHYPNNPYFLDLCDEQGFIVWEENHARGLSEEQMRNPNFEPQAEQCIREMIPQHMNHPSIIIWGILNECASDSEYGRSCYKAQFELIKKLDSSRPTSFASCKFMTDICLDLPDIVSYNLYPEWYVNKPSKEWIEENFAYAQSHGGEGKPFIISEIGAGGIYGERSRKKSRWTEDYQAEILGHQVSAVLSENDISGVFIWQFCDGRISEEWWGGRPRTMNNKGVVDEYRRPKLSYDVVREIFRS